MTPNIPLLKKAVITPTSANHPEGEAFLKNQIALVTPQYDAGVYTGRAISLGRDNEITIDTTNTQYLFYFNVPSNMLTQVTTSNDTHKITTGTLDCIITSGEELDTTSINNINANPDLLIELGVNGSAPGVNVTLDEHSKFYMCAEPSGSSLIDARSPTESIEILDYTEDVRVINQHTGPQTTGVYLDANGVPTSMNEIANSICVYDDTNIPTGYAPRLPKGTIEETISGEMQDFGDERLADSDFNSACGVSWTCGTGITISESACHFTGDLNANIQQSGTLPVVGVNYYCEIIISEYTSGSIDINLGGDTRQGAFSGVGTHIIVITQSSTDGRIYLQANASTGFTGSISSVSVKAMTTKTQRSEGRVFTWDDLALGEEEVDNNTFDTDVDPWTTNGSETTVTWNPLGKADYDAPVSAFGGAKYEGIFDGSYLVEFEITNFTENLRAYFGTNSGDVISIEGNGNYSKVLTSGEAADMFRIISVNIVGNSFTLDNVYIKKLITEEKYYINGVEQTEVPPRPDENTVINYGNTAVIGYPDTITQRYADFNVHSEVLGEVTIGNNLYPNWELVNGSHINQDIPTGTLPDGHVLVFNTANPCNATYNDNGNGAFSYLFNQVQDPVRLLLQQTIGYGIFEVGKKYRYQALVKTVTFAPIGEELRAINLASMVDMNIIDADNAMIGENEEYTLRWIDFEVTNTGLGRGNFRHGAGVWDVLTTAQETKDIAIYELAIESYPEITITGNNPVTVVIGDAYTDEGATAMDDIDGDITGNIQTINNVDINIEGDYTVTYYVDNSSGNKTIQIRNVEVVGTDEAPIYLMTEQLINDGSFDYLFNSAPSGSKWNGKLLTSTDTAWNPDSAQYPEDGTIDFSGGNKADTGWIPPQDEEWSISGIYNVVMGVSYDMYTIHYKGNQTCDTYLGSNTVPLAISETDKEYTPPLTEWIIEEEAPAIIFPNLNLCADPGCDDQSKWIFPPNAELYIGDSKLNCVGATTQKLVTVPLTEDLTIGDFYSATFEIMTRDAGSVRIYIGDSDSGLNGTVGVHGIYNIEYLGTPVMVRFQFINGTTMSVDNITVTKD